MMDDKASEELGEAQIADDDEAQFVAGRMLILNSAAGFLERHDMPKELTNLIYVADFLSGDSIRDKDDSGGVTPSARVVLMRAAELYDDDEDEGEVEEDAGEDGE